MAEGGKKNAGRLRAVENLRLAFDLFATADRIMRQNLRRRFPEEGDAEIEERLAAWLRDRPGAPTGDAPGPRWRHR